MRSRRVVSGLAALLVVAGAVVAAVALRHNSGPPQPAASSSDATPSPTATASASPGRRTADALPAARPDRLDIAAIGVHAPIGSVGLTASGAMEVPAGARYDEPAWYRYSPAPGAAGPAVIVGHVDSKRGPSVFFRLGALHVGDAIAVRRADGRTARFLVHSVRRFAKNAFPTKLVYGDTDDAELRL